MKRLLHILFLYILSFSLVSGENAQLVFDKAESLYNAQPDSALLLYQNLLDNKSTSAELIVTAQLQVSALMSRQQNFSDAFDHSELARTLAEELKDSLLLAQANLQLGRLYNEFRKEETAFTYFKAGTHCLNTLYQQGKLDQDQLITAHFNLAMHYKLYGHYEAALMQLDTCIYLHKTSKRDSSLAIYHQAEKADIYTQKGQTQKALDILIPVEKTINQYIQNPDISLNLKSYITIIDVYLGNAYLQKGDNTKAIDYYEKALMANQKYGSNYSSLPYIYEKRAIASARKQDFEKAYESIKKAKTIEESTTGLKSSQNSSLIEIKSKYQGQLEKQRLTLLEQENLLASQRQRLLAFRVIIVALISIILMAILLYRNRLQRIHFKAEKIIIEKEGKEAKQALEVKNKELTSYTLKFIDKEKTIATLSKKLAELGKEDSTVKQLLKQNAITSDALWEDFNTRFVEVNTDFYERLQKRFPELSATERKHCALIKLNFSAKEMAHLLNISPSSVHVSRYRLRQKFKLPKSENLTDFIAGF